MKNTPGQNWCISIAGGSSFISQLISKRPWDLSDQFSCAIFFVSKSAFNSERTLSSKHSPFIDSLCFPIAQVLGVNGRKQQKRCKQKSLVILVFNYLTYMLGMCVCFWFIFSPFQKCAHYIYSFTSQLKTVHEVIFHTSLNVF